MRRGLLIAAVLLATAVSFGFLGRASAHLLSRPPLPSLVPTRSLVIQDPYALPDSEGQWFRGNVHVASSWARGKDLPRALGDYYRTHGYQFLGIADANTYTWVQVYQSRTLTGIPMVLASYAFGDVLAMNMDHWVNTDSLQGAVDWIVEEGGLPILPAPNWHETPAVSEGALGLHNLFGLEVYNARVAALAPEEADATSLWDGLLARGAHVFAFAGDDVRSLRGIENPPTQGRAWIEVLAPDSERESLLASIKHGAFFASTGPRFTRLELSDHALVVETTDAESLRFIGRGGTVLSTVAGPSGSYAIAGAEGYVRVEALRRDGTRAWSQPYFLSWQ